MKCVSCGKELKSQISLTTTRIKVPLDIELNPSGLSTFGKYLTPTLDPDRSIVKVVKQKLVSESGGSKLYDVTFITAPKGSKKMVADYLINLSNGLRDAVELSDLRVDELLEEAEAVLPIEVVKATVRQNKWFFRFQNSLYENRFFNANAYPSEVIISASNKAKETLLRMEKVYDRYELPLPKTYTRLSDRK